MDAWLDSGHLACSGNPHAHPLQGGVSLHHCHCHKGPPQENTNSGRGSLLFTCRMRYYKLLAGPALPDLARAHAAEHGVRAGGCGRIRLPRAAGGA